MNNNELEKKLMSHLLFGDFSQGFDLSALYDNQPTKVANELDDLRNQYNQKQIPDKRFYPSPNVKKLRQFDAGLADIKNTNARDTYKYFDSETKLNLKGMNNSVYGAVSYDPNQRKLTRVADINHNTLLNRAPNEVLDTVLHESAHVDDLKNGTQYQGFLKSFGPVDWEERYKELESLKKYNTSANMFDNHMETRANLRSSLGRQLYGTPPKDHFKELLDALEPKGITYTPTGGENDRRRVSIKNRNEMLRAIEMDLFPRERWLDPREPTWQESLKDLFKRK